MIPKLFAFDLDGTLLDSGKRIRPANLAALRQIRSAGARVAFVSGRLGSAMRQYVPGLGFDPALVTLNGAEVFTGSGADVPRIRYVPLGSQYARHLTEFAADKPLVVNFYYNDKLYSVRTETNAKWMDLYFKQMGVRSVRLNDFSEMGGVSPAKIIFVGSPLDIDEHENHFLSLWGRDTVYVCRTWTHYLEFMDPGASKDLGLETLCAALGVAMSDVAAYGDAENDVPMLEAVGLGVAMKNASPRVKNSAARVTEMTNDEDWLAREWEFIKPPR